MRQHIVWWRVISVWTFRYSINSTMIMISYASSYISMIPLTLTILQLYFLFTFTDVGYIYISERFFNIDKVILQTIALVCQTWNKITKTFQETTTWVSSRYRIFQSTIFEIACHDMAKIFTIIALSNNVHLSTVPCIKEAWRLPEANINFQRWSYLSYSREIKIIFHYSYFCFACAMVKIQTTKYFHFYVFHANLLFFTPLN